MTQRPWSGAKATRAAANGPRRNERPANGSVHAPEHADDLAEDVDRAELRAVHVDRRHALVGRLQADPLTLVIDALAGRFALDHHDDDLAVLGGRLLAHEDVVAVVDPVFDHRVAADHQAEHVAGGRLADEEAIDGDAVGDVLGGQDRLTGGDVADDRDRDLGVIEVDRTQRATLELLADQVALALERLEVVVDAVRGADTHMLADLPEGRRVPALVEAVGDEIERVALARGEWLSHWCPPPKVGLVWVWLSRGRSADRAHRRSALNMCMECRAPGQAVVRRHAPLRVGSADPAENWRRSSQA